MKANEAVTTKIYLKNYQPHDFKVESIYLDFKLDPEVTVVEARQKVIKQNPSATELFLNGEDLKFISASLDGKPLAADQYEVSPEGLKIKNIKQGSFELVVVNEICPEKNTALEGLYLSGGILCTQNEPEGFRRITYFIDRPDNMAVYKARLEADQKKYPVLLANGNCIAQGTSENGRHWTEWEDPFPKPSYLFALVAGNLGVIEDQFVTRSGKTVKLYIYCDPGDEAKCQFAMQSLINSMKWDEDRFDLEYDLNEFRIVSVGAFNAGAMENKALNIFNSALVLADQKTATDGDYLAIESVIGHEYFHNWTGNRVTCRDWFQLTLKEGLTVFRDQEFSADLNSRPVQRILDVKRLREAQFPEDASPMAHPIRPETYVQINNFYTATVYEKGAEVIRMIHTLVGEDGFQKGMKKYFELFDGQAVTTEDFLAAMKAANPHLDDKAMLTWYSQAGTPQVEFHGVYDAGTQTYKLKFKQTCPPTPESEIKKPFFIPVKLGFLAASGEEFKPQVKDSQQSYWDAESVIVLQEAEGVVQFDGVTEAPVLSVNRSFSAPIKVKIEQSLDEKLHLLKYDGDHFNRFESAQNIFTDWVQSYLQNPQTPLSSKVIEAFRSVLVDESIDSHMKSLLLIPPTESVLQQSQNPIDFKETNRARKALITALATALENEILNTYKKFQDIPGAFDAKRVGDRQLRNTCLMLLSYMGEKYFDLVESHFAKADNMTDQICGLSLLNSQYATQAGKANQSFYEQWKSDDLVMQKWFAVQASDESENMYAKLDSLKALPEYNEKIPNYVRSLWGGFSRNYVRFHDRTGKGYERFATEVIHLDKVNRSVAAAMAKAFRIKPSVATENQKLINQQLERILKTEGISSNVAEVAEQILNS